MHLKDDCCLGASHPFGVICSNLMNCLNHFGLDYRGGWKLLMDDGQWNGKFSIIPFYLSACTKVHIQGYPLQGFRWFDIGKPETLAQAEEYYNKNNK